MEIPYTGRAIINDFYNGVEITVPVKKDWLHILFLSLWLCGWLAGEIFVPTTMSSPASDGGDGVFNVVWIGAWTLGGLFAVTTLWWNFAGKEIITISQGVLTIVKKGSIAKTKHYDLKEAKNFRAHEEPTDDFGFTRRRRLSAPWNVANRGTIKFDYGMETVKFADQLYQAEAEYILQRLRDKRLIRSA